MDKPIICFHCHYTTRLVGQSVQFIHLDQYRHEKPLIYQCPKCGRQFCHNGFKVKVLKYPVDCATIL
jgi:hypothetical protein